MSTTEDQITEQAPLSALEQVAQRVDPGNFLDPELMRDRTVFDFDYVGQIHKIFTEGQWSRADIWLGLNEIVKAQHAPGALQRFLVTRNLNGLLLNTDNDTRAQRYALHNECDTDVFLKNIKDIVLPMLMKLYP